MAIYCCKDCKAPKRHPGCHATCPEYLAEKTEHEKERLERFKERDLAWGVNQGKRKAKAIKIENERRSRYKK